MPNQHTVAPLDPIERFVHKIQVTSTCWLWTGAVDSSGYGQFKVSRKQIPAHLFAYRLWNGPIPTGHQVDHVLTRGCTSRGT